MISRILEDLCTFSKSSRVNCLNTKHNLPFCAILKNMENNGTFFLDIRCMFLEFLLISEELMLLQLDISIRLWTILLPDIEWKDDIFNWCINFTRNGNSQFHLTNKLQLALTLNYSCFKLKDCQNPNLTSTQGWIWQ